MILDWFEEKIPPSVYEGILKINGGSCRRRLNEEWVLRVHRWWKYIVNLKVHEEERTNQARVHALENGYNKVVVIDGRPRIFEVRRVISVDMRGWHLHRSGNPIWQVQKVDREACGQTEEKRIKMQTSNKFTRDLWWKKLLVLTSITKKLVKPPTSVNTRRIVCENKSLFNIDKKFLLQRMIYWAATWFEGLVVRDNRPS